MAAGARSRRAGVQRERTPASVVVVPLQDKLLLSVDEFAAVLSIGQREAYRVLSRGQVASVKIGRRRLIPRWAAEAFVRSLSGAVA